MHRVIKRDKLELLTVGYLLAGKLGLLKYGEESWTRNVARERGSLWSWMRLPSLQKTLLPLTSHLSHVHQRHLSDLKISWTV